MHRHLLWGHLMKNKHESVSPSDPLVLLSEALGLHMVETVP